MRAVFNITDYGAQSGGSVDCAEAIQSAIDAAAVCGGRVTVPKGDFLSGTIQLRGGINLHIEEGARLICNLKEGALKSFNHLNGTCKSEFDEETYFIFAKDINNLILSGKGEILGGGETIFFDDGADGDFHECPMNCYDFRPRFFLLENVKGLTVKDIVIRDAAKWTLHMAGCLDVNVEGITILNNKRGPNTDGIGIDSCKNVKVRDCVVETGDDAIVIKTTETMSAQYGSCEDVDIRDCRLSSRDSAIKIGTETWGDIRRIFVSDCILTDCTRAIGIWARDGATIEDVKVSNISGNTLQFAQGVRASGRFQRWWGKGEPIFINATYRSADKKHPGLIRNIHISNINLTSESSVFIGGERDSLIENIILNNINIHLAQQGTQMHGFFDELPSPRGVYAHSIPFLYGRYVKGLNVNGRVKYSAPYSEEHNPVSQLESCEDCSVSIATD